MLLSKKGNQPPFIHTSPPLHTFWTILPLSSMGVRGPTHACAHVYRCMPICIYDPHLTHTGWSRDGHTSRRLPLLKKKAVWESRNFNQRNQSARASTAASRSPRSAMPARTEPSTPTGARAACTRRAGRRSSRRDRAPSSSRSGGEGGGKGGGEGGGEGGGDWG